MIKLSSVKISSETVVLNTGPDAKARLTSQTEAREAVKRDPSRNQVQKKKGE